MSFSGAILSQVATELAAVDLAEDNERVLTGEAEIARTRSAMASAHARIVEIAQVLASDREADAKAVAFALLDEREPSEAAKASPSRETLESERDALRSGIRELQQRLSDQERAVSAARTAASSKVNAIAEPLAKHVAMEARKAAERIRDCWAALRAIQLATGAGVLDVIGAQAALDGLTVDHGLLQRQRELPVSPDIVDALAPVVGKGPALRTGLARKVAAW